MIDEFQPFGYEIESRPGTTILRLTGELDMAASPTLRRVLHDLQSTGSGEIVIDLQGLVFLDSMGLSALVEAHRDGQDGHRKRDHRQDQG